jgi:hypothetical protein
MGRFYLRCLSLTPRNLSVVPSSWIRKMGNDIVRESSMLLMKRRFANKLYVSRLPEEFTFMFANTFANLLFIDNIEDSCMMSLPIFLIHEEGTTNKFRGVNDRHWR